VATAERIEPRAQHEVRALLMRMGEMLAPDELERLSQRIYIRGELWRPLLNVNAERVCACLYRDTSVSVYLRTWCPDDDSGTHGHEGTSGAVVVAQGTIREERMTDEGGEALELRAGSSFQFEDSEPHRIANANGLPAATIHCFSPPVEISDVCPHTDA
jgi:mannose-6-phosphate isomerase-like protein (cupin superfamily)